MNAQIEAQSAGHWRLSGTLDFASVPELFAQTDELLAEGPVELDLSGVEPTSAGVALLIEWRRQAHRRGVELNLRALPDAMRRVAGLAQVEGLLTGAYEPSDDVIP